VSGGVEIRAPAEQTEGTRSQILRWLKQVGEPVVENEPLIEIETDKVTVEVASPGTGVLREIIKHEQEEIAPGELLGRIDAVTTAAEPAPAPRPPAAAAASASPTAVHGLTPARAPAGGFESGGAPPAERARLESVRGSRHRAGGPHHGRGRTAGSPRKRVGPPAGCSRRARRTRGRSGVSDRRACRRGRRQPSPAAHCGSQGVLQITWCRACCIAHRT